MGDYSDYCLIEVIDVKNKKSFIVTRSYIIQEIQRLDPEIENVLISEKQDK